MVQHLFPLFVRERNVAELDLALDIGHLGRALLILHAHRLVDRLEDALEVGHVVDEVVEDVAEVHDRLPETRRVARYRDDGAERLLSLREKH